MFMKSIKYHAILAAGLLLLGTLVSQAQVSFAPFASLTINIKAYQQITTNTGIRVPFPGRTNYSYSYTIKTNIINNSVILSNVAVALDVRLPIDAALAIAGTNSPIIVGPGIRSKTVSSPSYSMGDVVIVDGRKNVLYPLNGTLNNNYIRVGTQDIISKTNNISRLATTVVVNGLGSLEININGSVSYYYYGRNNVFSGYENILNVNPQFTTGFNSLSGAGELNVGNGNAFMPCDATVTALEGSCPLSFFQLFPYINNN